MGLLTFLSRTPSVSVLRLAGPIGSGGFGRALDFSRVGPLIERAFKAPRLAAVALEINSPGGAPVQSALIAERIRDHADKNKTPVLAFCEDVAASGGYWLACAADEIFVHENSIVGSIGVVSAGFGLDQAIARLGGERRVRTAGERKWRLDPFQPINPEDEVWLGELQAKIHQSFIAYVKERRGDRLAGAPSDEIFSGEAFLGGDAVKLGLVDGVGRLRDVIEARFGDKARFLRATPRRSLFGRLTGARRPGVAGDADEVGLDAEAVAAAVARGLLDEAERRAMMARFGL